MRAFLKTYNWFLPLLLFSIGMITIRFCVTGNKTFLFLIWNITLAFIPLCLSYVTQQVKGKFKQITLSFIWLLFFPNTMYIVTDMFHLYRRVDAPMWFDLILLFSAALLGLLTGLASLKNIEQVFSKILKRKVRPLETFVVLILCGYGIYLGRYERLNSWDIIASPISLLRSMAYHFIHPIRNIEVWGLSVIFATWVFILYKHGKSLVYSAFKQ